MCCASKTRVQCAIEQHSTSVSIINNIPARSSIHFRQGHFHLQWCWILWDQFETTCSRAGHSSSQSPFTNLVHHHPHVATVTVASK